MDANFEVVVVGGGAAGCAIAASLKKRQPGLHIAIIDPADHHYYQPAWTLVGAGEFDIDKTRRPMEACIPSGVVWLRAAVTGFLPAENAVTTDTLGNICYEQLVVAAGIQLNWSAIIGLTATLGQHGVTSNYRADLAPYTWQLVQSLQAGKAVFTQPPMPIKCAGAPQKALYLSCAEWLAQGRLRNIQAVFYSATPALFGVKEYIEPLMQYIRRYQVDLHLNSTLVEVDGPGKTAWFNIKDAEGKISRVSTTFDMLHVVPPQSAPAFIHQSPLANAEGWVAVDQHTLQHQQYANVFGVGDCTSTPNAKTAAAARKQVVIAAENLLAQRAGQTLPSRYDGYGSCPLTVEKGKIILAEFAYGGKLVPTFPWDSTRPRRSAWLLKKYLLPAVYWKLMLKGREWLARCGACG